MNIVTSYIFKEIARHSILGLLIFSFVLYVPHINRLLELVARRNLSVTTLLELFLLPLPNIFIITIPMAVLVGILIGLSRMASDGEIVALRASGVSSGRIVMPALLYAALGWILASSTSLYWAPRAGQELSRLKRELQTQHAPYELPARVFIEHIPNFLLFTRDTKGTSPSWHQVFIADTSLPGNLKTTTAETGHIYQDPDSKRVIIHLARGNTHHLDPAEASLYSIVTFNQTDLPLQMGSSAPKDPEQIQYPNLGLGKLVRALKDPEHQRGASVQLHYRVAIPVASLVLALLGIPLGLKSRKGGKAIGFMFTILLVLVYYVMAASGLSLSKQGNLPPWLGLWFGNAAFALAGFFWLWRMNRASRGRTSLSGLRDWLTRLVGRWSIFKKTQARTRAGKSPRRRYLQILDGYILRSFFTYLGLVVLALIGLSVVFDFYQLFGHILKNQAGVGTVLDYYRYLVPQVLYFPVLPLAILVAVLISFSLLTKSNQITAVKASGVSLYRISIPIFIVAGVFSGGLFLLEENYLPEINQRQDALRDQIKGRPPRTYTQPDRHWIFGEESRIFNYRYFDSPRNLFVQLSVFELDPETFQIRRRIYAERAHWEDSLTGWVLENGWVRDIEDDRVTQYRTFKVDTFSHLTEKPDYFKKEVKPHEQMNAIELRRYLQELQQSGLDVARLSVQLHKKFSYPLMACVVAFIGIPFSFTVGKRGALSGLVMSLSIAMAYWVTTSFFEALGALGQLPPVIAAWASPVIFGLGGVYLLLRVKT